MSAGVWLGIAAMGAVGSLLRFAAELRIGPRYGTLFVNVTGAFLLGLFSKTLGPDAYRVLGTGLLGAYTTFSAWMLQSRQQGARIGALDLAAGLLLGLGAAALGQALTHG